MKKEAIEYEHTFKDLLLNDKNGFIPMPRQLSRVLGFNATGLLEELYDRYDYYTAMEYLNEYDEFFYTVADVEINTGLSKKEQMTAIKKLKEYKFIISTTSRGMPQKRYFKMNTDIDKLLKRIYIEAEEKKLNIMERNKSEIERLLGI